MTNKNKNLHKAKSAKNDEFYTQLSDIEKELGHYKAHFKDKIVFCNCDDPQESNFWQYFSLNFEYLGLKKLISTHYETDKPSYKLEIVRDIDGNGKINGLDTIKAPLKQNGDFRSPECIEILKEADIVVTNPPFSLFREYVAQLMEYEKKFLIMGNMNAITYKEIFKLIKDNKVWLGNNYQVNGGAMFYEIPENVANLDQVREIRTDSNGKRTYITRVQGIRWFTNLDYKKRHEDLFLYKYHTPNEYPRYHNYDAIEVNRVKEVPMDYDGVMGVPISFLDKYNPKQFEILGAEGFEKIETSPGVFQKPTHKLEGSERLVYKRIWIKNRKTIK